MPEPPEVATPTAISTIASAATPASASVVGSTGLVLLPGRLVREPEQAGRKVDAHDLELLEELGPDPGRLEPALYLALDHAGLLEDEDILHDDDVAFHALDF